MKKLLFILSMSFSAYFTKASVCDSFSVHVTYDQNACNGDSAMAIFQIIGGYPGYNIEYGYTSGSGFSLNNVGQNTIYLSYNHDNDPASFLYFFIDDSLGCHFEDSIFTYNSMCDSSSNPCDSITAHLWLDSISSYACPGDSIMFLWSYMNLNGNSNGFEYSWTYGNQSGYQEVPAGVYDGDLGYTIMEAGAANMQVTFIDSINGCYTTKFLTVYPDSNCDSTSNPCDSITAHLWLDSISSYACPGDSIMFLWSYMNLNVNPGDFSYTWTYGGQSGYQGEPAGLQYGSIGYLIMEVGATVMQVTFMDTVDGNACHITKSLTVFPEANCDSTVTQIQPLQAKNPMSFYPNPASQDLNIQVSAAWIGSQLELVNSLGQVVKTEILQNTNHNLSVGHLAEGLYFAQIKNIQQGVITQKIVLKR